MSINFVDQANAANHYTTPPSLRLGSCQQVVVMEFWKQNDTTDTTDFCQRQLVVSNTAGNSPTCYGLATGNWCNGFWPLWNYSVTEIQWKNCVSIMLLVAAYRAVKIVRLIYIKWLLTASVQLCTQPRSDTPCYLLIFHSFYNVSLYACVLSRDHSFPRQILPNSAGQFAKFHSLPWQFSEDGN